MSLSSSKVKYLSADYNVIAQNIVQKLIKSSIIRLLGMNRAKVGMILQGLYIKEIM